MRFSSTSARGLRRCLCRCLDRAAPGSQQAREGAQAILFTLKRGNIHQRGNRFFGSGRFANGVQATREEPAFDLHQLAINRTHQGITAFDIKAGGIVIRQVDVFIEVALTGCLNNRVHDLNATAALAQLLVRTHKLTELFEALVEASIFSRRRQITDG